MRIAFIPYLLFFFLANQADVVYAQDEKKPTQEKDAKVWSKYDFIPGDKIIFEDNLEGEQNGEFPSKWNLHSGRAEIAQFRGENVIYLVEDYNVISPLMTTSEYLPDVFTIEFDLFTEDYSHYYDAYLEGVGTIRIGWDKTVEARGIEGRIPGDDETFNHKWQHIAIAFNRRSLKVYFNENRILNIPNIEEKPTAFTVRLENTGSTRRENSFIRNIRIAAGGKRLYDQVFTEGKIITHGILFDVGKATIKPQSMGVINEIVKLMKESPTLKFSIEGHTDSDGDEAFNQKLSEQRAEAVKGELVKAGIVASRSKTKGWGESKPIDANVMPEGKGNNRRVEFVKI